MPSAYIPHAPSWRQLPPDCVILLFDVLSLRVILRSQKYISVLSPLFVQNCISHKIIVDIFAVTSGPRRTVNQCRRGERLVEKVQPVLRRSVSNVHLCSTPSWRQLPPDCVLLLFEVPSLRVIFQSMSYTFLDSSNIDLSN